MKGGTLFLGIREAKFLYQNDISLDPFIRVTVDSQKHQTKTVLNAGKNPFWKDTLKFKISKTQASNPDKVSVFFEAFNQPSETSELLLGQSIHALSKIVNKGQHSVTLNMTDKKNKAIGSLQVDMEYMQDMDNQDINRDPRASFQPGHKILGTLILRPQSAEFSNKTLQLTNYNTLDPYIILIHGNQAYQTAVCRNGGLSPQFNETFCFNHVPETVQIKCFDSDPGRDEIIGEGRFQVPGTLTKDPISRKVDLFDTEGKNTGYLYIEMEFFDGIFNVPIKVYPPSGLPKNEEVSRKIKYSNPDKYKKNLTITSSKPEVVAVKTKQVVCEAGGYCELRFKFLGTQDAYGERIPVMVGIDDGKVLEEVLLFKFFPE